MLAIWHRRYLDIPASVCIYDEHRGYTSIERVLDAVRSRHPGAHGFIAATLLTEKLPALYFNPRLPRRTDWYDPGEAQPVLR